MIVDRLHPYSVTIKERYPLTKVGSTKLTYHVTLNLKESPIEFRVGDSLGIYAQNDPILVQHLINALKATGEESIFYEKTKETLSLRDFLTFKANLARISSSFLKLLHEQDLIHDQKNQIHRLLEPDNKELLHEYLSAHDPLDVLKECQCPHLPLQAICQQFSPLLPRFYSAASSKKVHPDHVDLVVAVFTYTHSGEKRYGVASHFLCHLAELERTPVPVYVQPAHQFTLPQNPDAPIIMVGPGTGIAPFRGFLQERLHLQSPGKNWLFFGERHKSYDFFYEDYWRELVEKDKLRLDLAFSRNQESKLYVQHKMLENAKELWQWLQEGAYFYVCGDAEKMAKDVDAALHHIAMKEGSMSMDQAKAYVKQMRQQKRYLQDVY